MRIERYSPLYPLQEDADVMLAQTFEKGKTSLPNNFFVQPKLDGVRCLANCQTGKLYSRRRHELLDMPHVTEAILNAGITQVEWLDGELFAPGKGFQSTVSLVKRAGNPAAKRAVQFFVFDVVSSSPFSSRFSLLEGLVRKMDKKAIQLVPSFPCTKDELNFYHEQFKKAGFEGTIIRIDGHGYENKRSKYLLKFKDFLDQEYKIVGFQQQEDGAPILGSLILELSPGKTFTARPMGMDRFRKEIWDHQDRYLGKMATVKYQELSREGVPRFPIVTGIRLEQ